MVSCTRIEGTLQAYIDGELGDSDRVIFEQHVQECEVCRGSFRAQQRTNATLFAAFSNDRMQGSLCSRVMAHLPVMEEVPRDADSVVVLINERAKNPRTFWSHVGRLMPAAAVAILVFVTLILNYSVTDTNELGAVTSIGMVTHAYGEPVHAPGNGPLVQTAELKDYIMRGDRFETPHGGTLILALTGPTSVKIAPGSSILVTDARNITLDYGRIWLDVGRDGKLFHVYTPRGEVTVYGTCFTVSYANDKTTVTVQRGAVQVEKDKDHCWLEAGQQAEVQTDGSLSEPQVVDASVASAWARLITPDPTAESAFNSRIQINAPTGEIPSRQVNLINTYGGTVTAIHLYWQPRIEAGLANYCAYDLYVAGPDGEPIAHKKLESSKFNVAGASSLDIQLDTPITGLSTVEIRLVPDLKLGGSELADIEVKADVTMEQGS